MRERTPRPLAAPSARAAARQTDTVRSSASLRAPVTRTSRRLSPVKHFRGPHLLLTDARTLGASVGSVHAALRVAATRTVPPRRAWREA